LASRNEAWEIKIESQQNDSIVPACANKRKMIQLADACNERHQRHERQECHESDER
jgi:antitoxin component of MazEF toxin-antitoxin module